MFFTKSLTAFLTSIFYNFIFVTLSNIIGLVSSHDMVYLFLYTHLITRHVI